MSARRLAAPTPAQFFATHLDRFQRRHDPQVDDATRRWYDTAEAVGERGPMWTMHADYVDEGATPQAAAKWVVGGYLGSVAASLGFVYAYAGAAVLDLERVRFGTHPDGWIQLVDLGEPRVAVVAGHPWSGQPGVRTVADDEELASLVVTVIRRFGDPLVTIGRRLARVGAVSLWAEVADALGMCVLTGHDHPADPAVLRDLRRLLDRPDAPWRKRPELWLVDHRGEQVTVARKGGCCLAYQSPPPAEEAGITDSRGADPYMTAWEAAFPPVPGEPAYCSTCSLREAGDCAARLLWERDYERRHHAG